MIDKWAGRRRVLLTETKSCEQENKNKRWVQSGWHRLFWLENIHIRRFAINRNWSFNGLSCEVRARERERGKGTERARIYMKRKKNRFMSISNFISLVLWSVLCRRVDDHYQHRRARERERENERFLMFISPRRFTVCVCVFISSRTSYTYSSTSLLMRMEEKKRSEL